MKSLLRLLLLLIFTTPVMAAQDKLALVIGNANYIGAKLGTPINDADDMAHQLTQVGFKVDKITDANQRQMEAAMSAFSKKLTPDSIAVFYYSGHAVEVRGQNYLLPVGKKITEEANVKYDAVNVGRLLDSLEATNQGLNLVILDACRDNPLIKGSKSGQYGLSTVTAPNGSLVVFATAPGQVALTGRGRNSLFTKALLKHLKTPDLEVSSMLRRVSAEVKKATGKKQRPWISSDYTGNFAFVGDADDQDKLYVAVLDFDVDGVKQSRGKIAKSMLIRALEKTGKFRAFARDGTLRHIADEFQLEGSDLMEDAVAKKLTRLHSVAGFVAGEIIGDSGEYFVSLKLVKTTGEVKTSDVDFNAARLTASELRLRMPILAAQLAGISARVSPTRVVSTHPIKAKPLPNTFVLTLRSNVNGDSVRIDGRQYGATRLDVRLKPGEHKIKIEKPGYEPYETTVELVSNETIRGVLRKINRVSSRPTVVTPKPVGRNWTDPITGIQFVYIPKGCFNMGSPSHEEGRDADEAKHTVCIDQGFWMSQYEITNAQFRKMVSSHDSKAYGGHSFNEPKQPAVYVSWDEATEYAQWLSDRSGHTFRLPTEAEWEYAARGNTSTARYWGDNVDAACQYANVADKTAKAEWGGRIAHNCIDGHTVSAPVGQFKPNAFGLYDMLGNVWEWTCSAFSGTYDGIEKACSSTSNTARRVFRGGGWGNGPGSVRSAFRGRNSRDFRGDGLGFRVVRTHP